MHGIEAAVDLVVSEPELQHKVFELIRSEAWSAPNLGCAIDRSGHRALAGEILRRSLQAVSTRDVVILQLESQFPPYFFERLITDLQGPEYRLSALEARALAGELAKLQMQAVMLVTRSTTRRPGMISFITMWGRRRQSGLNLSALSMLGYTWRRSPSLKVRGTELIEYMPPAAEGRRQLRRRKRHPCEHVWPRGC